MLEVHGDTGSFIAGLGSCVVRDHKILLICNGLLGREPGYLLSRIVYTHSAGGSLGGISEEGKLVTRPVIGGSSFPCITVVIRRDSQICGDNR